MSQNDQILRYLKTGGALTPLRALQRFGCLRLAARIYDLEARGHRIARRPVKVGAGKIVTAYYLEAPS